MISDEAKARRVDQVDRMVKEGLSERQIAKRIGVSRSTVWNVKQSLAKSTKGRRKK